MGKRVWILCVDRGAEGLSEPFIAFATEAGAEGARDLIGRITSCLTTPRVVEAPFYELTAVPEDPQP